MDDVISRQAAIDALKEKRDSAKEWYEETSANGDEMMMARAESAMMTFIECSLTIKKLPSAQPEPCEDTVSRKLYEQIKWERDLAVDQLADLGYGFGEKKRDSDDAIPRKYILDILAEYIEEYSELDSNGLHDLKWCAMKEAESVVENAPSVMPKQIECEDAVNRDSVKFLLCKETCHPGAFCPDGFCKEICEKVDALPSATSKQRMGEWIPVSERLPESKPEDLEYPTVIACCEDGEVMTACFYESTKEWGIGEYYDRKINPVAWMPLPEPYREDGGE